MEVGFRKTWSTDLGRTGAINVGLATLRHSAPLMSGVWQVFEPVVEPRSGSSFCARNRCDYPVSAPRQADYRRNEVQLAANATFTVPVRPTPDTAEVADTGVRHGF